MNPQTLAAFLLFAFATAITPGPNNLLLMSSGVNYGFRGTMPHMLGVSAGFAAVLLGTGLGLGEVFARLPAVYVAMKWLGAVYFVWFAWKLAAAPIRPMAPAEHSRPLAGAWRFHDGFAFQLVNPKGWLMALAAFSSYVPTVEGPWVVTTAALMFAMIAVPCFMLWVCFGSGLRRFLERGQRRRVFNVVMALLLLASLVPLFAVAG